MADCPCEHLRFEDGSLYLVCVDCGQVYGALDRKGGEVQYTKMSQPRKHFPDTRHGRWVSPRTEPAKK